METITLCRLYTSALVSSDKYRRLRGVVLYYSDDFQIDMLKSDDLIGQYTIQAYIDNLPLRIREVCFDLPVVCDYLPIYAVICKVPIIYKTYEIYAKQLMYLAKTKSSVGSGSGSGSGSDSGSSVYIDNMPYKMIAIMDYLTDERII